MDVFRNMVFVFATYFLGIYVRFVYGLCTVCVRFVCNLCTVCELVWKVKKK